MGWPHVLLVYVLVKAVGRATVCLLTVMVVIAASHVLSLLAWTLRDEELARERALRNYCGMWK